MKKPRNRTGKFVYNRMKETIDNRNRKKESTYYLKIYHR